MNGEVRLTRGQEPGEVRVDLADLVCRADLARVDVAVGVAPGSVARVAAGEVVVLVGRDDEERVALVDAVTPQPLEERCERVVVLVQRLHVVRLARPRGARVDAVRIRRRRERVLVVVVRVRDVTERDRNAGLLHLRDVAERHLRGHSVEAREARLAERVVDGCARRVVDDGAAVVDCRVDVLGAEEPLEVGVAARLVRQVVRLGVRAVVADAAVGPAVDRDSDEVGQRLRPRRGGEGGDLRVAALDPLGRAFTEDLRHVAGRIGCGRPVHGHAVRMIVCKRRA